MNSGRTNLLILGSDVGCSGRQRDDRAPTRSDTVVVASLDPSHHRINLLSIPRDTRVAIPGRGLDKVNAALAYGGPELSRQTIAQFLQVPIDHWIVLRLDGLMTLVEAVGGVEVVIDRPMRYRDRAAGLTIALNPGRQTLNGEQAQEYVRFRHDERGDIGRVQRQQAFMSAMADQLLQPATLVKLPLIIDTVRQNIETDMAPTDLVRFGTWLKGIDKRNIRVEMLPGTVSGPGSPVSYWLPDAVGTKRLAMSLLTDQAPVDGEEAGGSKAIAVDAKTKLDTRITILNGTKRTLLGNEAARVLREAGWTVWEVGTAAHHSVASTLLIGDDEGLKAAIAGTLGVTPQASDSKLADAATDVTVILGEDFTEALRQMRAKSVEARTSRR